jgi:sorting nexin-13
MSSFRLRKIDFVVLLTRYFVDDIASHVRLYRLSKEKRTKQEILFKEHGRRHPDDLESIFFDMELEMEQGRICRDLIVSSPAYERACLHDITDLLLYLLLPSEDFRCRPFRFLASFFLQLFKFFHSNSKSLGPRNSDRKSIDAYCEHII